MTREQMTERAEGFADFAAWLLSQRDGTGAEVFRDCTPEQAADAVALVRAVGTNFDRMRTVQRAAAVMGWYSWNWHCIAVGELKASDEEIAQAMLMVAGVIADAEEVAE